MPKAWTSFEVLTIEAVTLINVIATELHVLVRDLTVQYYTVDGAVVLMTRPALPPRPLRGAVLTDEGVALGSHDLAGEGPTVHHPPPLSSAAGPGTPRIASCRCGPSR